MTRLATERTCPKCGRTYPSTEEFWYFHKSGAKEGLVTGYCRPCQTVYNRRNNRGWEARLPPAKLARRRLQKRDYWRRVRGTRPDRYRVSMYEALLDGLTADQVAAAVSREICPDCGSVRLEAARTRDGAVVVCWRCGWRDRTDRQAAS